MKKKHVKLLICIFYFLPVLFYAQPIERGVINHTDENGLKQGVWKVAFENSKNIRYHGQFKDDIPYGKFHHYYSSGEKSAVMEFYDNAVSKVYMFHKNGNLLSSGSYIDKKKDSTWSYYNDRNEVLNQENYSNGMLNGEQVFYYPGNPSTEKIMIYEKFRCVNDLRNGLWEQFYKIGRIKAKGTYLNGYLSGQVFYYSSGGRLEIQGQYRNGFKEGCWMYYGENREVIKKKYYKRDDLIEGDELEEYLNSFKK